MRIVFLGTPEFAVTVLSKLVTRHTVVAVISQPDRAKDRKGNYIPTPVKQFACEANIPVYQYEKIGLAANDLRALNGDLFVTAAYGQLLTKEILDIPRYGIINVHASLLPKFRGSSPITSAILCGEEVTGVTIMQTELGMDTGDILASRSVKIGLKNAGELTKELAEMGGELLLETIDKILNGSVKRIKQDESIATKCKKMDKEDARINWHDGASAICNAVRAFNPNPVAFSSYCDERIKIYEAEPCNLSGEAGRILFADNKNGIIVACGTGSVKIKAMQMPGKKIMTDKEIINGKKLTVGEYFGR